MIYIRAVRAGLRLPDELTRDRGVFYNTRSKWKQWAHSGRCVRVAVYKPKENTRGGKKSSLTSRRTPSVRSYVASRVRLCKIKCSRWHGPSISRFRIANETEDLYHHNIAWRLFFIIFFFRFWNHVFEQCLHTLCPEVAYVWLFYWSDISSAWYSVGRLFIFSVLNVFSWH